MAEAIHRADMGLGCVKLGSVATGGPRAGIRLVHAACDRGIGFFDTADAYGDGASERVLGRALRGARRDGVVLATKGGYLFRERSPLELLARRAVVPLLARASAARSTARSIGSNPGSGGYRAHDFSPGHLRAAVEGSLRRLGTDRIDLYQLHGPPALCDDDTLAAMDDLLAAGKILAYGAGLETLDDAATWVDVPGISSLQIPFGLLDPEAARSVLPAAAGQGVKVIARGVFAAGLLGEIDHEVELSIGAPQRALRRTIRAIAIEHGINSFAAATWYVGSRPGVAMVLLGMSSLAHLEENLRHAAAPDPPTSFVEAVEVALAAYVGAGGPSLL